MRLRPFLSATVCLQALTFMTANGSFAQPQRAAVVEVQRLWEESSAGRALLSKYGSLEKAEEQGATDSSVAAFERRVLEEVARVARDLRLPLVFNKFHSGLLHADAATDITDAVIARLGEAEGMAQAATMPTKPAPSASVPRLSSFDRLLPGLAFGDPPGPGLRRLGIVEGVSTYESPGSTFGFGGLVAEKTELGFKEGRLATVSLHFPAHQGQAVRSAAVKLWGEPDKALPAMASWSETPTRPFSAYWASGESTLLVLLRAK